MLSEPWTVRSAVDLPNELARTFAPIWRPEVYGMSMWTAAQPATGQRDEELTTEHPFVIWPAYGLPDNDLFTMMLRDRGP